jgi:hypothetical protein
VPPEQPTPQAPQLPLSLVVSTQAPEQEARPAGQAAMQRPSEHSCFEEQAWPHAPQFVGSAVRRTHWVPHKVVPWGQRHRPVRHSFPASQALPQAPQLFESEERSTQAPEQTVEPVWQAAEHCPCEQTWFVAQAMSQAPQFLAERKRSTQ